MPHDVAELFSPPRLTARASRFGLRAGLAYDLSSGTDLGTIEGRGEVWQYLGRFAPRIVVTSAPCTLYSLLTQLWNRKRMSREVWKQRRAHADSLMQFSMAVCRYQRDHGRFFLHEHPARADSWELRAVRTVERLPGVYTSCFDQCVYGLVAPYTGEPCKKATKLLHNMPRIHAEFDGKTCACTSPHRRIVGQICGVSMARHCQVYGPTLCDALLRCFVEQLGDES